MLFVCPAVTQSLWLFVCVCVFYYNKYYFLSYWSVSDSLRQTNFLCTSFAQIWLLGPFVSFVLVLYTQQYKIYTFTGTSGLGVESIYEWPCVSVELSLLMDSPPSSVSHFLPSSLHVYSRNTLNIFLAVWTRTSVHTVGIEICSWSPHSKVMQGVESVCSDSLQHWLGSASVCMCVRVMLQILSCKIIVIHNPNNKFLPLLFTLGT